MKRIYESDALRRDEDHFTPAPRRDPGLRPQAMRSLPSKTLTRFLFPRWVHHWAIDVRIDTPQTEYPIGTSVPFSVTMRNRMPFPVMVSTTSRLRWDWFVDDHPEGSRVAGPPDSSEEGAFVFDRGERKVFQKRWDQRFRDGKRTWTPARPGVYTIAAGVNTEDPKSKDLWAETTVTLVEDGPTPQDRFDR